VTLRIPVREGPAYRLRNVGLTGPPGSEAEAARERMDLRQGDLYRHGRLLEALGELRREAGRRGQATWSATVTLTPQPAAGVVDVTVSVNEGPAWSVGRIAFRGARRTRDGTLRRALALDEGERLDMEAVGTSTRRLEALGVVSIRDVEVVPSPRIAAAADVTFVLEERAVPRYGLSGGINALEGASIATQLGAANAFGRAERLLGSFQIGGDVRAWSLSAGLPFVFGTAWAAGLEAHAQRLELPGVPDGGVPPHVRDADGISLFATRPLGARGSLGLAWSLDDVSLTADTDPQPEGFGTRRERRLALSAGWDGWDHLWKPRRGLRTSAATRGWGGPLGGQVDAFEVQGRAFALVPLGRKAALGAGARAGFIHSPDGLAGLPFDDRYLLGGEGDLRGFDARTVGPRDAGGALVAGTRFVALQAEAHLDLPLGLRALAFLDAGNAWASEPDVTADGLRVSTGLELRFELPVLRLPLRLMGAFNPVRDPFHPRTAFRVALGPLP
jgi:outer membrane protein assembly factor BamA